MRCEEIQELIMTDYIDGELDPSKESEIARHIGSCVACRALEADLRRVAEPLKTGYEMPPERVWKSIERRICGGGERPDAMGRLRGMLRGLSLVPRIRPAMAVLTIVLALAVFIGYQRNMEDRALASYMEGEIGFLYDLNGSGDENYYSEAWNFFRESAV